MVIVSTDNEFKRLMDFQKEKIRTSKITLKKAEKNLKMLKQEKLRFKKFKKKDPKAKMRLIID